MKRIGSIDFLKFIFACVIVMLHGNYMTEDVTQHIFVGGYISVEFFFIVSGYFMAAHYEKAKANNQIQSVPTFIKNRFLGFCPNLYVAWVIGFIVTHVFSHNVKIMASELLNSVWELSLTKMAGMIGHEVNGPIWYLSAMLISMAICYALMNKLDQSFFTVIAPIGFVLGLGYLRQLSDTLANAQYWTGFAYKGVIRATVDILAGVICFNIVKIIGNYDFTKLSKCIFTFIEWMLVLIILAYIFKHGYNQNDYLMLLGFMVVCTIALSGVSYDADVFQSRVFARLGEYSFSLFLGHFFWVDFYNNIDISFTNKMVIYILTSILSGLFIMKVSNLLRKWWTANKDKILKMFIVLQ